MHTHTYSHGSHHELICKKDKSVFHTLRHKVLLTYSIIPTSLGSFLSMKKLANIYPRVDKTSTE